jgi:hypothetical protein
MAGMIVGISGFARSGKDTSAEILVNEFGFKRMAFADALKYDLREMIWQSLDRIGEDVKSYDELVATQKEKARPLMVEYGRIMRELYPEYWIRRLFCDMFNGTGTRFVIPDVRYKNEAEKIRELGGVVIGVMRPNCGPANAEEEMSFSKFTPDYIVDNDASISRLHEKIVCAVKNYSMKLMFPFDKASKVC